MNSFIPQYEVKRRMINDMITLSQERVRNAKAKYEKAVEDFENCNTDKVKAEINLRTMKIRLKKAEYSLQLWQDKANFIRPEDPQDVMYRCRQYKEFSKLAKEVVPLDLHLCFHGCPITAAKHILEDGALLSSVDRVGFSTSQDGEDQISVTTINDVIITVQDYCSLMEYELPAGCIFAILPKDENEISTSKNSLLIGNVSFKEHPERLYAIITTPENIERVTEWAKKSGVDSSKICDFDGFIQLFEKSKGTELIEEMES